MNININKCYQTVLATGDVTPPAYQASRTDNSRAVQENHKALACQRPLIQAEHIQKTPAIQSQPIEGPLAPQSSFCRGTAKLLLLVSAETQSFTTQKRLPPLALSLYHLISSGNFPLQLVPGDYHLALKPWCTSAHRTNETPELGDGQIAKWYLSSMALWLCFALPPPLWVVWSVTEEPSEDWEGRELFLDKGRKLRTTQLY